MDEHLSSKTIAPFKVLHGKNAWKDSLELIPSVCKSPLILGRSKSTILQRLEIIEGLKSLNLNPIQAELKYDCCEEDLIQLQKIAAKTHTDCILAAGGGKVLDSGKLVADRLDIPCITVPLSASTCAGWTALANIYSPSGAFVRDQVLDHCPELMIFDHDWVRQAPKRTLASGIADALAKWYESSVSNSSSNDGLVQQAVQMARVLRDQLLIDGEEALNNPNSDAWVRVAEGCALTAGLIGGIGGSKCRTVAAHAIHNGLTQLSACKGILHGEKVGYGILVQLRLEETIAGNKLAGQARSQLVPFLKKLALPINLEELGLAKASLNELQEACRFASQKGSDIHNLPFSVTPESVLKALITAAHESSSRVYSQSK